MLPCVSSHHVHHHPDFEGELTCVYLPEVQAPTYLPIGFVLSGLGCLQVS